MFLERRRSSFDEESKELSSFNELLEDDESSRGCATCLVFEGLWTLFPSWDGDSSERNLIEAYRRRKSGVPMLTKNSKAIVRVGGVKTTNASIVPAPPSPRSVRMCRAWKKKRRELTSRAKLAQQNSDDDSGNFSERQVQCELKQNAQLIQREYVDERNDDDSTYRYEEYGNQANFMKKYRTRGGVLRVTILSDNIRQ